MSKCTSIGVWQKRTLPTFYSGDQVDCNLCFENKTFTQLTDLMYIKCLIQMKQTSHKGRFTIELN